MSYHKEFPGSRRHFLAGSLGLAVAAAASAPVFAGADKHAHHHHGESQHADLVDSALHCIRESQFCRDHCIELIKTGDTTPSDCLDIVTDTIAICEALAQLSVSNNRHLRSFAAVCIDVCKDCEDECRKHKDMHEECRKCMESCTACIKELEKIAA